MPNFILFISFSEKANCGIIIELDIVQIWENISHVSTFYHLISNIINIELCIKFWENNFCKTNYKKIIHTYYNAMFQISFKMLNFDEKPFRNQAKKCKEKKLYWN